MDMNLLVDIIDFLEGIDDSINDFADRIEIEPIRLSSDTYLTGFKRLPFAYNVLEAHVKEINTIKTNIDGDIRYILAEPSGEVWFNCNMFADSTLKHAFNEVKETFKKCDTFHLMTVDYMEKGSSIKKSINILYQNKRAACKEALQLKKIYDNVKVKFQVYKINVDGEWEEADREPTDFEIATAAV